MPEKHFQKIPFNFGAIDQDFKKARAVILPVPYDLTTSWTEKGGPRNGPLGIIYASRQIDDIEDSFPVFTSDEIEVSQGSPLDSVLGVESAVKEVLAEEKIPILLGGDHSVSLGAVRAVREKYKNLSVLQLDAHPDLLDECAGNKYGHASVMRRVRELGLEVCQVGLRSIDPETRRYIEKEKIKNIVEAPEIPAKKILGSLSKNIYLSVDLDVFDPSFMPSVQSPVPGGLGWHEVLNLIGIVAKEKNIVGVDVVELSPIPGLIAPDILAAKLVYKIMDFILR